eukprot:4141212-Pyramimonas_sp.AAC.1
MSSVDYRGALGPGGRGIQGERGGTPRDHPDYGGFVSCRPGRWFLTPWGSFSLERSGVSET